MSLKLNDVWQALALELVDEQPAVLEEPRLVEDHLVREVDAADR